MIVHLTSIKQLLVQSEVVSCILLAYEDLGCTLARNLILLISVVQAHINKLLEMFSVLRQGTEGKPQKGTAGGCW